VVEARLDKQSVDVAHPLAHNHAELSEVRSDGAERGALRWR
jgi:hypothetical protein